MKEVSKLSLANCYRLSTAAMQSHGTVDVESPVNYGSNYIQYQVYFLLIEVGPQINYNWAQN